VLSFKVRVDENVSSKVGAVQAGIERGVHRKVIAKAAAEEVKDNFVALDRARHRGGSFNFYGRAALATSSGVQGKAAYVSIDHEGIALRRFGGTVRPRTAKFLSIPAIDEAQGKRAREFSGLHFRRNASGNGGRLCDVGGRVFYWLVEQSTHQPDPSVLPTDAEITEAATDALKEWVELTEDRANG
jgi:hypothetical protein